MGQSLADTELWPKHSAKQFAIRLNCGQIPVTFDSFLVVFAFLHSTNLIFSTQCTYDTPLFVYYTDTAKTLHKQ